ncbi:MAG: hypothetical protein WKF75_13670 [Singulisphaera sp.]
MPDQLRRAFGTSPTGRTSMEIVDRMDDSAFYEALRHSAGSAPGSLPGHALACAARVPGPARSRRRRAGLGPRAPGGPPGAVLFALSIGPGARRSSGPPCARPGSRHLGGAIRRLVDRPWGREPWECSGGRPHRRRPCTSGRPCASVDPGARAVALWERRHPPTCRRT